MADPKILSKALEEYGQPESAYRLWALQHNVPESNDYNMRGFYEGLMTMDPAASSSINPNDNQMHFPDKWKLPNHQTFSTDSQYYDPTTMPNTPTWAGGPIGNGAESWTLRRPDGSIVAAEAPWYVNGIKGK